MIEPTETDESIPDRIACDEALVIDKAAYGKWLRDGRDGKERPPTGFAALPPGCGWDPHR